jgi:two-component system chemotaxis sensor kinase CheA
MSDQALLEIFRESTLDQLARAEAAALDLERAPPGEAGFAVEAVFRAVHTIKGDAATLRFEHLALACHDLETFLDALRQNVLAPAPAAVGCFLAALDALRGCLDAPDRLEGRLEAVAGLKALLEEAAGTGEPGGGLPAKGGEPGGGGLPAGADAAATPDLAAEVLELSYSVRASHLDQLMEDLSGLMDSRAAIAALAREQGRFDFSGLAGELERQLARLGQSILSMRLLPLQTVIPKYRRLVRDLAAQAGKEAGLTVSGEMCELDKTLIEKLNAPFVHIMRNAVSHGLETPAARLMSGKPPGGTISLDARQDGAGVVISISDDGAGVDARAVMARAVQAGLIPEDARLGEGEMLDLIFLPGLSTAREVDGVSGRGVGMDAVRQALREIGGDVAVSSQPGRGTTFTLTAPLSLSLMDCLLVRAGGERYFLPMDCVEQCLEDAPAPRREGAVSTLAVGGRMLGCVLLDALFELPRGRGPTRHVVAARHAGERFGVAVDEVLGLCQVMVKPLSGKLIDQECFLGAAPDEDGRMSLILSPGFLAKLSNSEPAP